MIISLTYPKHSHIAQESKSVNNNEINVIIFFFMYCIVKLIIIYYNKIYYNNSYFGTFPGYFGKSSVSPVFR